MSLAVLLAAGERVTLVALGVAHASTSAFLSMSGCERGRTQSRYSAAD
jgi:hypothetical protein